MKYPVYINNQHIGDATHEFEAVMLFSEYWRKRNMEARATKAQLVKLPWRKKLHWQYVTSRLVFNGTDNYRFR